MNLKIPENIVFTETDGEAIILDIASGYYFGLDEVGVDIWKLIERYEKLSLVKQEMLKMYDVREEILTSKLETFLENLIEKGLIVSQ